MTYRLKACAYCGRTGKPDSFPNWEAIATKNGVVHFFCSSLCVKKLIKQLVKIADPENFAAKV